MFRLWLACWDPPETGLDPELVKGQLCVSSAIIPSFLHPLGVSRWCWVCGLWTEGHLCWLVFTGQLG